MISDAERSKIAQKLREDMELCVSGGHYCFDSEVIRYLCGVLGFRCSECRKSWKCLETLADLIEPSGHECVPGECPINVRHDNDKIDRDALLALADEMYEFGSLPVEHPGVCVLHNEDFSRELGYARRIRKALGVES